MIVQCKSSQNSFQAQERLSPLLLLPVVCSTTPQPPAIESPFVIPIHLQHIQQLSTTCRIIQWSFKEQALHFRFANVGNRHKLNRFESLNDFK